MISWAVRFASSPAALVLASSVLVGALVGCTVRDRPVVDSGPILPPVDGGGIDAYVPPGLDGGGPRDAGPVDAPVMVDPDAACATTSAEVMVERVPVDIIWVVDSSSSMEPAIRQVRDGLNAFADRIFASGLDYRVILLSMRGTTAPTGRYAMCVPPPLATADCGDGERFFHVDVDVRSTQPIEQILGTLAQSDGYAEGDAIGSAPWRHLLRDGATKTIVVVTDDNARTCDRPVGTCAASDPRLTATSLEDFPGGGNPFNANTLGPGIRTTTYGALFEDYTFDAIYGWGSETDPSVRCEFADGSMPDSPGYTYTTLVARTGGVRAQICDGPAAWGPFFDAVATGVVRGSRIECDLGLPPPPDGSVLDPRRVNVQIRGASGTTTLPYTGSEGACDPTRGGWHYDDASDPSRVILCPSSCDFARTETAVTSGGLDVVFGCASILI